MEQIEMEKYSQKAIDSNVLVGVFLPDDRLEHKALEIFRKLGKGGFGIYVHPLVLIETLSILKYKGGVKLAIESKKTILSNFLTDNNMGLVSESSEKYFEKYANIGMVDAILLDYCLKNKMELITLDKTLNEVWKRLSK
ncbi:MAG: PIN domain-containing protein [Microgenomates group bacterium]